MPTSTEIHTFWH